MEFMPGKTAIIRLNVHQNDVRTDLFDVTPRDDIFAGIPEESEKFSGTRNDDFFNTTGTKIELHIAHIA